MTMRRSAFVCAVLGLHGALYAATAAESRAVGTIPGTFQQIDLDCGGYVTGFAIGHDGRVYCRANVGGIYRSDDHGRNGYNSLCADPKDLSVRYYLLRTSGFYRSDDRGASWRRIPGLLDQADGVLSQDPKQPGRLWASVSSKDGRGLLTSADGGAHWRVVGDFSTDTTRLDAHDGAVVYFGRRPGDRWNKIYYSPDEGKTWGEITRKGYRFPTTNGVAIDVHHPNKIWISTNGRSEAVFTMSAAWAGRS